MVCIPQPETVKTTRAVYDLNLKPYCLPKCPISLGALLGHCHCGEGCCCNCGHPHVRHVLMKKFASEEHQTCKCVPVCVPACEQACGPGDGGCSGCCQGVSSPLQEGAAPSPPARPSN
jgi:hypothetical protein